MIQINGDINMPAWTNSIVQITMALISMVFTGVVHIMALPSLVKIVAEKSSPEYRTQEQLYAEKLTKEKKSEKVVKVTPHPEDF